MLDEVSRLLPTLAKTNQRDEETLKAFGTLWDELSPRLSAAGSADGGGGDVRDGASGGGSGSSGGGGGGGGGGSGSSSSGSPGRIFGPARPACLSPRAGEK